AGAVLHIARVVRADRGAKGFWLPDRFPRRQRHLRRHVRGGADRRFSRLCRRPHLSSGYAAAAGLAGAGRMSTAADIPNGAPEKAARIAVHAFWFGARLSSVVVLLAAWELLAHSGWFTSFQLP